MPVKFIMAIFHKLLLVALGSIIKLEFFDNHGIDNLDHYNK